MPLYVYGEDGLTLCALTMHRELLLQELEDDSLPDNCLSFYRLSLGRGKNYGEIDGILVSSRGVYVVESKWDNLASRNNAVITLEPKQVRRNEVYKWYLANWTMAYCGRWREFKAVHKEEFANEFEGAVIPNQGRIRARELEFTLSRIRQKFGQDVFPEAINVLLYFYRAGRSCSIQEVRQNGDDVPLPWQIANLDYQPWLDDIFVELV